MKLLFQCTYNLCCCCWIKPSVWIYLI